MAHKPTQSPKFVSLHEVFAADMRESVDRETDFDPVILDLEPAFRPGVEGGSVVPSEELFERGSTMGNAFLRTSIDYAGAHFDHAAVTQASRASGR